MGVRYTSSHTAQSLDAARAIDARIDWESLFDQADCANDQQVANAARQLADPARNRWWRTRYPAITVSPTVVHPVQYRVATRPGGTTVELIRCAPTTGHAGVARPQGTNFADFDISETPDPAAWWAWVSDALRALEEHANAGYHAQLAAGRTPATRRELLTRAAAQHASAKRR